jgi:hypothetical protein
MTTESVYWVSINNVWRVTFYCEWRERATEGKMVRNAIYRRRGTRDNNDLSCVNLVTLILNIDKRYIPRFNTRIAICGLPGIYLNVC